MTYVHSRKFLAVYQLIHLFPSPLTGGISEDESRLYQKDQPTKTTSLSQAITMQKQSQPFLSASACISLSEDLHNTEQVNCLNAMQTVSRLLKLG